jgi:hypothetical protein
MLYKATGVKQYADFPGNSVVNSFTTTEEMLLDVVRVVPYVREHEQVWSPKLVTVLLEACSQLDSLWKAQASLSRFTKKGNLDIKDYFAYYGKDLGPRWIVAYGEEPELLKPYECWEGAKEYVVPDWWAAYNKVKHNRLANRTSATLKSAISALGALFLAIVRCKKCHNAIMQVDWFSGHPGLLLDDSKSIDLKYGIVESELFTYALGWGAKPIPPGRFWSGYAGHRFTQWFTTYSLALSGQKVTP